MSAVDWGNVPTWLGAIGTSGSIIVLGRARLKDRREQRAQQARLIRVFAESQHRRPGAPGSAAITGTDFFAVVRNLSDNAITDVVMWVQYRDKLLEGWSQVRFWRQQVAPGDIWEQSIQETWIRDHRDADIIVRFLDARGGQWHLSLTNDARARPLNWRDRREYREYLDKITKIGSGGLIPIYIRQDNFDWTAYQSARALAQETPETE